jgi:redox-sensitive bicupin YhaK (pirin superfamily)
MPQHRDAAAIRIAQQHAALLASRLGPGQEVTLPDAPFVHLFVADGSADLEGSGGVATGDAARVSGGSGQRVTAGPAGAELLVWEMHARLA